jgi:hypothetical protein
MEGVKKLNYVSYCAIAIIVYLHPAIAKYSF